MKKLLFVLLIALVASTVVQTEDKELDSFFNLIAKFISSLVGKKKHSIICSNLLAYGIELSTL